MSVKQTRTIDQSLRDWAKRTPDAVSIMASGQAPMTYGDLAAQADHVREILLGAGIGRGDRVATAIRNGPEMVALLVGVTGSATAVPLNPANTTAEFETLFSAFGAKVVIVESGRETPAATVAEGLGVAVIVLAAEDREPAGAFHLTGARPGQARREGRADAGDIALLLHTSGTTSRPKMVPLTHANLMASAMNFGDWYALESSDRTLSFMPYYHIQGLVGGILAPLVSGGSIVAARGFDGDSFFALLDEFRPTWYTAGPTYHQAILARASQHRAVIERRPLRFIRSSSAPLAPQTMLELEQIFGAPVLEGFGLTESCLHSLSNPLPPGRRKPGCVGLPAGTDAAIIDESGTLLAPGASGEVVLRGASVMAGYEANPEANAAAFIDGWFRTGDQGHFDEEGYLVLTGRFKELINRGGEKISPVEIDHVLLDHPDVAQAVTFSVPHPTLGEDVGVAIVRREGADVSEADIRTFAAKALAPFKVPRNVVFVDAIPKSTVGKSQRVGLADKLGLTKAAGKPTVAKLRRRETPTETAVGEIWRSVLRRDAIGVDDDFFLLGGDSLQATHVIADILQRLEIDSSFGDMLAEASTIARMARLIEDLRTGETPPDQHLPPTIFPLRQANGQDSLFFLPLRGGHVLYAGKLVSQLGPGTGAYGMRLDPELVENLPGCTLQDVARRFAADLHASAFPEPYHLVGYSFAGFLAFETARHLATLDAQVGVVALLDSSLPRRFFPGWYSHAVQAVRVFRDQRRDLLKKAVFGHPNEDPDMVLAVPGFGSVDLTQVPESRHHILRHLFRAGVEYEPGPYSGQLTLFRSTRHRRFTGVPAELGWGPYAKGGVNVIRFAGDHYDITRNDHTTARVAEILDRIVERGGT